MTYIATFFSHFGAMRFKKDCESKGFDATLMPVPRTLSSSCGTCVRFTCSTLIEPSDEVEQIVELTPSGYNIRYRASNS